MCVVRGLLTQSICNVCVEGIDSTPRTKRTSKYEMQVIQCSFSILGGYFTVRFLIWYIWPRLECQTPTLTTPHSGNWPFKGMWNRAFYLVVSWISGWWQGRNSQKQKDLNCSKSKPEAHLSANLWNSFTFLENICAFYPTSERRLLSIGFTKSVLGTLTFE